MKITRIFTHEKAQVGIGTLIIFIAMVLVAAIAAAVLINTSGVLQQKAQTTGTEAIGEVSSNIEIVSVVGHRTSSTAADFDYLDISVKPSAGAGRIDLGKLVITLSNGTSRVDNLVYTTDAGYNASSTQFNITEKRDADDSFTNAIPVINSGDLVVIRILANTTGGTGILFPVRSPYKLEMIPEVGNPVSKEGTTASSYGIDLFIDVA